MFRQRVHVLGDVPARQQSGVHAGVKGLDAPVQDLGELGEVGHRPHVDGGLFECLQRSPGGVELEAEPHQASGEGGQAGLVTY